MWIEYAPLALADERHIVHHDEEVGTNVLTYDSSASNYNRNQRLVLHTWSLDMIGDILQPAQWTVDG